MKRKTRLARQSRDGVAKRAIARRAADAVIWAMPIVNYDLMYRAMERIGGAFNQIVYWSRLSSWKNQTLTPNPDSIYVMPFFDTRVAGPMVLEIPPADGGVIVGSVMDSWQCPFEDVGPAGADKGKGGKYLILPPDHAGPVPDGYLAFRSETYRGYALLRSMVESASAEHVVKAVAYAKRIKLYPLAKAADPPATKFVDAIDRLFDATITYDARFFESLARMVEAEPWLARDKAMIDPLKSLGIEKGKPFKPRSADRRLLQQGARDAREWFECIYPDAFSTPFYGGARWALPVHPEFLEGMQSRFADPDRYSIDDRGLMFSFAFFCAKHLGAGQFYLMTIKDKNGRDFDGARAYRLTVPADAPVKQYWSATAYDRATHGLIRNRPWSSRSSQSAGLQKNPDGSVDVFFAPKAPTGKRANWVPTSANGQFEVLFRLYGPEKSFFDKKWKLPDIVRL